MGQAETAAEQLCQEMSAAKVVREKDLAYLKLLKQQLIGRVQACDDVVRRLELTELETEAAIDQVNSIEEYWNAEDYDRLKEVTDLVVGSVNVRATDKAFEISVRMHPLPVIREVLESTPIERKVAPTGVEPVPPP
jgi:hypothetical protein